MIHSIRNAGGGRIAVKRRRTLSSARPAVFRYPAAFRHFCAFRPFAALLCLLATLLSLGGFLTSCGRAKSPADIWSAFAERYPLPPGHLYDTNASEGEEGYLSPSVFAELYARPDGSDDREDVEQCVVWKGSAGDRVTEAAVFLCRDRERAERVSLLCMRRLTMIRSLRSYTDTTCADTAIIRLHGRYVIFLVLPDNDRAWATMKRLL